MNSLPSLVSDLSSSSSTKQLAALNKLLDLSSPNNNQDREAIVQRALHPLIKLLSAPNQEVVAKAANVLRFVGRAPSNRLLIHNAQATQYFLAAVNSSHPLIQENSIGALLSLAPEGTCKQTIGRSGCIPKLIAIINGSTANEATKTVAVSLLNSLAMTEEFEKSIAEAGGVEAVVQFLKTGGNDAKIACCRAITNLCYVAAHKRMAVSAGVTEPLLEVLRTGTSDTWQVACSATWTLSTWDEQRIVFGRAGAIQLLGNVMAKGDQDTQIMAAGALAALTINNDDNQDAIAKLGLLASMVVHLTSKNPFTEDQCTALDNITKNVKNVDVVAEAGIQHIVEALRSETNPKNHERLTSSIRNMSVSEANKTILPRYGTIEILLSILDGPMENSKDEAATAIWNLSLDTDAGKMILAKGGERILTKVKDQSTNQEAKDKAQSALRSLSNLLQPQLPPSVAAQTQQRHIMISYNWTHQQLVLKIASKLKETGYKIWIDVEEMAGSALEKMALAVEESAVVLICATPQYQASQACRTEAEYTYQLKKPFIALLLDGTRPTSWLGALLGTQIYVDFSKAEQFEAKIQELTKLVEKKGASSQPAGSSPAPTTVGGPVISGPALSEWTQKEIDDWLTAYQLDGLKDRLTRQKFTGIGLQQLVSYAKEKEEKILWMIFKEFPIDTVGERIQFRAALTDLVTSKYRPKEV